uniref:glutathione transferase n=1 Tax=Mycena chlorophos TaxID=658473 RepID=A0ABQ0LWL1_MYCCL|nr:predicted protein [Mycena chlorophos]
MVLKLYCTSTAGGGSGVVALIMQELNIPFEFVPVAFAPPEREHKTEKFMNTLHPFGQVPVLAVFKKTEVDPAAVAARIAEYEIILDGYERILSKTKYLAGDEFTLADLFHVQLTALLKPGGYLGDMDLMHKERRPKVARWWDELSGRQSWVQLQKEGIKSTC